jgi:pyridoxamine 5'-phosphate oxidase
VEKVRTEESDAYFHSRPLDSRIGAWASPQSAGDFRPHGAGHQCRQVRRAVPAAAAAPAHTGAATGCKPDTWQFWQGRKSRLHDRLRYTLQDDGGWLRERLAP